jgi:asparagine synthase (glutamine-hydrolysing)
MEGEVYDVSRLKHELEQKGSPYTGEGQAGLLLRLFDVFGEAFASKLNGAFVAAIWDLLERKLWLVNDRMGLYPLYYAQYGDTFLFASGVRALLAHPDLPRTIDPVAIAQFLTFDHVLNDHTLLMGGRLMPQGSIMTIHNGSYTIRPYNRFTYPEIYPLSKEEEYQEELVFLLRQAVIRQAADDLPKAVMLSGGLDSRIIIACLNEMEADWPLHTFTWGIPDCDDARYAKEIAAMTRAQHHFFELKPDFLLRTAENSVRITDGLGNIVNLHAIANLDEEVSFSRVIFKGFMGDAMFGFAVVPPFWGDYDQSTAIQVHFGVHESQGVITFHPAEHERLFMPGFLAKVGDGVMAEYRSGMAAADVRQLASQRLYFDLTQRVPRMTLNGVEVVRSQALVRLPFCDNDLLDFSIQTPLGLLLERRLVQRAFTQAFPSMAKVPLSWTGLPMAESFRSLFMRGQRLLQWHLYKRGLSSHPDISWSQYKDYRTWFRTLLRPWVEGILLGERSMERGYYQPEAIRKLVMEHMGGEDRTVALGALLTIELWHRQFID